MSRNIEIKIKDYSGLHKYITDIYDYLCDEKWYEALEEIERLKVEVEEYSKIEEYEGGVDIDIHDFLPNSAFWRQ